MSTMATRSSLEVTLANFLDGWRAQWRYEPRWPAPEAPLGAEAPEFRVWLPLFHPARRRLGRAFHLRVGAPVLEPSRPLRDLPCYTVSPIEEGGRITGFAFYDENGRVSLRASSRAD